MVSLIGIKQYNKYLNLKNILPADRGLVGNSGDNDPRLRSTEVRWIRRDEFPEIFREMHEYGRQIQAELGLVSVMKIVDPIQLSTYYPGDFYGWHKDYRDMSCSLLLSDKFTGGRLEFRERGHPLLREAGKAIFFPNIEHRVKPVLTGVRDSLVVWWRV